ncbi:MAG: SGNH/GDSL hydrolase family protein [Anaerolineae bacterium]|nr:SGNH/GDSL hydrolase family protein [Anaerolineae bacterium]
MMTLRGFFIRLGLFLAPVVLVMGVVWLLLRFSGEVLPFRDVIDQQRHGFPTVFGRAYRDNFISFKATSVIVRKPAVITLGSSRVMQFRAELFNKQMDRFYNAGGGAACLYQVSQFVHYVDAARALPAVIIIGLDQDWFNPARLNADNPRACAAAIQEEGFADFAQLQITAPVLLGDMVSGKVRFNRLIDRRDPLHDGKAIGLNAIMRGKGFRNDGSFQYGVDMVQRPPVDERFAEIRARIQQNTNGFERSATVAQPALDELNQLLAFLAQKQVKVILFTPPYAPSIYKTMIADGGYGYIPKLADALKGIAATYNIGYFDFGDVSGLGFTNEDFSDGFHGMEAVYLRLYQKMLDAYPDVLGVYSDPRYLMQIPITDSWDVFGNKR